MVQLTWVYILRSMYLSGMLFNGFWRGELFVERDVCAVDANSSWRSAADEVCIEKASK